MRCISVDYNACVLVICPLAYTKYAMVDNAQYVRGGGRGIGSVKTDEHREIVCVKIRYAEWAHVASPQCSKMNGVVARGRRETNADCSATSKDGEGKRRMGDFEVRERS